MSEESIDVDRGFKKEREEYEDMKGENDEEEIKKEIIKWKYKTALGLKDYYRAKRYIRELKKSEKENARRN